MLLARYSTKDTAKVSKHSVAKDSADITAIELAKL